MGEKAEEMKELMALIGKAIKEKPSDDLRGELETTSSIEAIVDEKRDFPDTEKQSEVKAVVKRIHFKNK